MDKRHSYSIVVIFVIITLLCVSKYVGLKDLRKLSPKQIVSLFYTASKKGDIERLKQIIYFPPGTTEKQKEKKLKSYAVGSGHQLLRFVLSRKKVKYEKYIDQNTAEVGVVTCTGFLGFGREIPVDQVILKKDEGIWKYSHERHDLAKEQLIETIKKNPKDASAYYYYGFDIMSENPPKANSFFKKYYELEPDGFWVTADFKQKLRKFEDTENYEKATLAEIQNLPSHRIASKAKKYRTLGQLFTEKKDYKKAKRYFDKAVPYANGYPLTKERLTKSRKELQLRMDGEYYDILTELEARENTDH